MLLFAFIITAFTILSSNQAMAQFGKNKVQYKQFKWKFIQSKHFDIYFYQGGEYLADYTAKVAEQSLDSMSKNLNGKISNRIPIIVFESHNDFQQNNVIDVFLPEGVGGVTELFKNRILVPFEGELRKIQTCNSPRITARIHERCLLRRKHTKHNFKEYYSSVSIMVQRRNGGIREFKRYEQGERYVHARCCH